MLICVVYIASDSRLVFAFPSASCPTIPIVELTSSLLVPFIFNHFHNAHFATSFLFRSMQEWGCTPLPLRFPSSVAHTSKRVNGFLPIPFPFTLLRTLLHDRKLNSFVFRRLRTLCPKTPGVGVSQQSYFSAPPLGASRFIQSLIGRSLRTGPGRASSLSTVDCQPLQCSLPRNTSHGTRVTDYGGMLRGAEGASC
jgi:hypothetical protein